MEQQQPGQQPYDGAQAYPTGINPELVSKVAKDKKKEKKEQSKAILNKVGALRDDPDRQRFVIKVYGIVSAQLSLTVLATAIIYNSESAKEWIRANYYLHYVALVIGIALMCTLVCC